MRALEAQLLNHLPNGTRREDLSFLDLKSIDSGDQWMERLPEAQRHLQGLRVLLQHAVLHQRVLRA